MQMSGMLMNPGPNNDISGLKCRFLGLNFGAENVNFWGLKIPFLGQFWGAKNVHFGFPGSHFWG